MDDKDKGKVARNPYAPDERTRADLSRFFAERWRNNFMDTSARMASAEMKERDDGH